MAKAKKIITITSIIFFGLWSIPTLFSYVKSNQALAQENENESENENRPTPTPTPPPTQVIDTSPAKNQTQKTETITIYKKLSDTITTKTDTITRHDSDGDGLYDDEDPHPTINEYFIVKDANLNGIDDRYEQ